MAITFEQAKQRYENRFPDKQLLSFSGTKERCQIHCPIHQTVDVSRYSNVVRSETGCPRCAADTRDSRIKATASGQNTALATLGSIRRLPPTLSDADFRTEVLRLTSEV